MNQLRKTLKNKPIVYITRHIDWAIGLSPDHTNYYIVANSSPFAKEFNRRRSGILLIEGETKLDTAELLTHPTVRKFLNSLKSPRLVVFKNTTQIERICKENDWELINPPAELAARVEEKISQLEWLGPLTKYLPPHKLQLCGDLEWTGERYIVQFNRAHTGNGTILVESRSQLEQLGRKFPRREARVTRFLAGPSFTNNNIVWGKRVLNGNISYQITGLNPFTNLKFATIGNDWALPYKILSREQIKKFMEIARAVGQRLAKHGWRGLYGIDTMVDNSTGKMYLIEINARQPASTVFESELQIAGRPKVKGISVFEAHLASLLDFKPGRTKIIPIKNGAQVVQRVVTEDKPTINDAELKKMGLKLIAYDNIKPGQDLLRLQSTTGLMEGHGEFNQNGKKIIRSLQGIPL